MCAVDLERSTPSGLHDIYNFLCEDLPNPMPAFAVELKSLYADGDTADLASNLFQESDSAVRLASRIVCVSLQIIYTKINVSSLNFLEQVLDSKMTQNKTESYNVSFLSPAIDGFLEYLSESSSNLRLVVNRNSSDSSFATIAKLRPDCCVWAGSALVFKGEDKGTSSTLDCAIKELGTKMTKKWNPLTLGSLPYLLW